MKNKFTLIMALATATLFVACGGSGDTNTASAPVNSQDPMETAMSSETVIDIGLSSSEQFETTPSSTSQGSEDLVDYRDGNTYRTVTIGPMTWMAENLRYETNGSFCPGEKYEYDSRYGCYYTHSVAVSSCPVGWHLSTKAEWETLFAIAGGGEVAANALKSTSGWADGAAGTDDYGFSALPSGSYYNIDSRSRGALWRASYWTSIEESSGKTYVASIDDDVGISSITRDTTYNFTQVKNTYHWGFPVRCVKN